MSQLMKAKQRLLLRSNSIIQTPDEESQFKIFTRTGNAASIPKLNKRQIDRSSSQIQIQDNGSLYRNQMDNLSPNFARTERNRQYSQFNHDPYQYQAKSQRAQHLNLFAKKQKRKNEYSHVQSQIPDITFTQNERSVYNQSPSKVVKNTVHNDRSNIIITKRPPRISLSPFKPKQCSQKHLQQRLDQQKAASQLFVDDMFPPRFTIIFNKKHMYLQEGLKLDRLTNIYKGSQISLLKFCQPTLMIPGKYTSPALYSALAIMSQEPTRILNIIGNQQFNQTGIYYVHICKDGVWRYVIIDDYFPVKILAKRALLFLHTVSKNNTYEFWPCVIQKALAKVYGTYQDIFLTANKGVKNLLKNLTGFPVSEFPINKDFRTYLIVIDTAIKKKQIVVVQNIPQQLKATAHVKGIQSDLSYQIIEVKKSYIVLRNLLDKDLVTKLTFEQALIFRKLLIFRSEGNYTYISKTLRHKYKCYSVLKIIVKTNLKCYWDVWQNSEIYYKNHIGSHIEYQKSRYKILLKQIHQNKQETNSMKMYDSANDDLVVEEGKEVTMSPGIYLVMVHLCQKKQQDFTLSYYGQQNIEENIVKLKNMEKWADQCQC